MSGLREFRFSTIWEFVAEYEEVIVGSIEILTVLSAVEITNFAGANSGTEPLNESCCICWIERSTRREVLRCIRKGKKAVFFMHFGLVNATNSPGSGLFEAAADALAAGDFSGCITVALMGS